MDFCWDVAKCVLDGVDFLHTTMNLVHTDIKLENILLTDLECDGNMPSSYGVKLCDFGGATYDNERKGRVVNTRQYRAPEVILDLGWSTPSDIWSVGCVLAEVSSGELLFATHGNTEHLAIVERRVGPFPRHMVDRSPLRRNFTQSGAVDLQRLSRKERRYVEGRGRLEEEFVGEWGSLVRGVLQIDPGRRWKAGECLKRFFEFN